MHQTYSRLEVIVVDDGSTDDSREVISKYGEQITAIIKQNGGQALAFNIVDPRICTVSTPGFGRIAV